MTTQNGGGVENVDVPNTAALDTNDTINGGDKTDIQKQFDDLKAQFEELSKASKGKDSKISQLLKEKETQNLASKTAEEQLEYYRTQTAQFERKEAYRAAFKEVGLNPDDFSSIIDEKEPAVQAGKFAALLTAAKEEAAKTALEKFKADELAKVGGEPKPKETVIAGKDTDKNAFLRGSFSMN